MIMNCARVEDQSVYLIGNGVDTCSQCRRSPSTSSLRNGDGPKQQKPRKHGYGRLW